MNKVLYIILISLFSLTIISCSSSDDSAATSSDNTTTATNDDTTSNDDSTSDNSTTTTDNSSTTTDTTAPVIAEVTVVTTPTNDSTPNYTFSSDEAGTITYGGSCSSDNTTATTGNNTITLVSLSEDTYSNCTIIVTDSAGNVSNTLTITSFIVDTTSATLVEVTAVTTPDNDTTPDYTFSSSEAGTITYGGSCSSSTTSATTDNNTITLVSLSEDTYSDCTITVTDNSSNSVTLNISSFVIDTTAPVIEEVTAVTSPDNDTTPNYTFSSDEAGTITYGGSCSSSTTSATTDNNTVTFNTLEYGTYDNCTITVTDNSSNVSNTLTLTSFNVLDQMGGSMQGVELSLSTAVTTLAGTGSYGSTNGTGTSASFYSPVGITTDGTNLYVADTDNHLIRQIVISTGVVTTVAGTGSSGSANGTGTSASFNKPYGITTDGTNLYVADRNNHLIRQIVISTGAVTTVAGTGSDGAVNGTGTSASFYNPYGITTDGTNLYVAGYGNHLIRQIVISTGVVTTVAGTGSSGSVNGTGTSASFYDPTGITTDGTNLYLTETGNYLIRQIE